MKNSILTIIKKELARFFGDKKLVFTTILMPGLIIYIMYSFMGTALKSNYGTDEEFVPSIEIVNLPQSLVEYFDNVNVSYKEISDDVISESKESVHNNDLQCLVYFPQNFDKIVEVYDNKKEGELLSISIYYNSASSKSNNTYNTIKSMLDNYETSLTNLFNVNNGTETYNLSTEKERTGSMFSTMLPMLLMIFLFQACMGIAPESIAGEKERGTIAPLLITPIKRSELAIGKIIALASIAFLSGLSSTIGTLLSLPKMMSMGNVNTSFYGISDYFILFTIIISTILFLITIISIISVQAKTVKEATVTCAPLMVIIALLGISSMFGGGAKQDIVLYFIPFYNSVQCMAGIFTFNIVKTNLLIGIISNMLYTGIGVFILAKMFKSERIIFKK